MLFVDLPPNGRPVIMTNPWVFSKKMMLVITASASPGFWCLALCWSQLPGFSALSPFSPLLSCVVIWWEKWCFCLPFSPHTPHMSFKFYYCNKSALCWLFSALCHGGCLTCLLPLLAQSIVCSWLRSSEQPPPLAMTGVGAIDITQGQPGARLRQSRPSHIP